MVGGVLHPDRFEPAPEHALDRPGPLRLDLDDLGEARRGREIVRVQPLRGLAGRAGRARPAGAHRARQAVRTSPRAARAVRAGRRPRARFRPAELRDRALALLEALPGLLLPALELPHFAAQPPVVLDGLDEGLPFRAEPFQARLDIAEPRPLVGERGFGRVRLPNAPLPPGPERLVLGPERGERPLRRVEPALGAGRLLAGPLDPGTAPRRAAPSARRAWLRPLRPRARPRPSTSSLRARVSRKSPRWRRSWATASSARPTSVRTSRVARYRSLYPSVACPCAARARSSCRLDRPLPRAGRLELHLLRADRGAARLRLVLQAPPAKGQQLGPQAALLRLEDGIALRLRGLALEAREVLVELLAEIAQPVEVVVRLAHPALGLAPALPGTGRCRPPPRGSRAAPPAGPR